MRRACRSQMSRRWARAWGTCMKCSARKIPISVGWCWLSLEIPFGEVHHVEAIEPGWMFLLRCREERLRRGVADAAAGQGTLALGRHGLPQVQLQRMQHTGACLTCKEVHRRTTRETCARPAAVFVQRSVAETGIQQAVVLPQGRGDCLQSWFRVQLSPLQAALAAHPHLAAEKGTRTAPLRPPLPQLPAAQGPWPAPAV